jgi:hypothetical protein
MDKHSFTIHFGAAGYTDDHLEFLPDTHSGIHGGSISDALSLPDWKVVGHESLVLPYTPIEAIHTGLWSRVILDLRG